MVLEAAAAVPRVQRELESTGTAEAMTEAIRRQQADTAYQEALSAAAARLPLCRFGRAEYADAFDHRRWDWVTDDPLAQHRRIVLRPGVSPTAAVKAWYRHPERWSLDCAQAVAFPQLYAKIRYLEALHPEQKRPFDREVHGLEFSIDASTHEVTGLPFKVRYERDAAGAPFRTILWIGKLVNLPPEPAFEVTHLVSRAPVGSTVTWDNAAAAGTAWRSENTLKVGPDLYAAHPLGELTAADMVPALVQAATADGIACSADDVFVSSVTFMDPALPLNPTLAILWGGWGWQQAWYP